MSIVAPDFVTVTGDGDCYLAWDSRGRMWSTTREWIPDGSGQAYAGEYRQTPWRMVMDPGFAEE